MVKGSGNIYAKIVLIGEAPGSTEVKSGKVFTGSAGHILDAMLNQVGIDRDSIWIDNVMPIQPVNNKFDTFYDRGKVPSQHLLAGRELLYRTIKKIKPNIVVALGNEALKSLTPYSGIGNWRGSIYFNEALNTKVMGTYHPAGIMRNWEFRPLAILDLQRAKSEGRSPEYCKPYYNISVVRDVTDALLWKDKLLAKQEITFDIETSCGELRCIGFAWSNRDAVVYPFSSLSSADQLTYYKCIRSILQGDVYKVKQIAQNAQFDVTFLKYKYKIEVNNLVMDTMVAFHCIYPELPKSLATLCSIYTPHPFYKNMRMSDDDNKLYEYNGIDCAVTFEAYSNLKEELKEFRMNEFYYKNSHALLKPLIDMQLRGVKIDLSKREELKALIEARVYKAQTELNLQYNTDINVNSAKQMKELLYEKLKLPVQYNRVTHTITANAEAIEKLAEKSDNETLNKVLSIRHDRKLLSDNINVELLNGRMHTAYNISGTVTGRLSSGHSLPLGTGSNLQNIPAEIRSMYIPDDNMIFISADLKQAEARVVAYLSQDDRLIKLMESGEDIFTTIGQWVFEKETISKRERKLCKALAHGSHYGMKPPTFRRYAKLNTIAEAEELQNRYFSSFPMIKQWQAKIVESLRNNRILSTPLGRKRVFFGRWGDELFRNAYAFIPQSTVSDVCNAALINLYNANATIMLQVHDNVVIQVSKDISLDGLMVSIENAFNIPITIHNKTFRIPVDVEYGNSWGSLEHFKTIVYK